MHARAAAAALLCGLLVAPTAGCVTAYGCASWVDFEDEESRVAESGLVVDVEVVGRDGTEPMFGADAHAWAAEVRTVVADDDGDVRVGDRLRLVSTPDTCAAGGLYGDGDPLDTTDEVRVYLRQSDTDAEAWELLTPFQGVGPLVH